jgi:membrane associated rhomboid family serine protease
VGTSELDPGRHEEECSASTRGSAAARDRYDAPVPDPAGAAASLPPFDAPSPHPLPAPAELPPDRPPLPASKALAGAVVVFYLLELLVSRSLDPSPFALRRLGEVRHDLVFQDHEYYRLVCGAFLHGGWIHITLNGLALIQLAPLCEVVWGRWRMLAVYLLSALGGTLLSALFLPAMVPSVGASGAILGLAGLLVGATWFAKEPFRGRLRQLLGRRLLGSVVLTFAIGIGLLFIVPIIDNYGHLGGFTTGVLASLVLRDPSTHEGRGVRALALGLSGLCLAAFVWMAVAGRGQESFEALSRVGPNERVDMVAAQLAQDLSADGEVDAAREALLARLEGDPASTVLERLATSFEVRGGVRPEQAARAATIARAALARLDQLPPPDGPGPAAVRAATYGAAGQLVGRAGDAALAQHAEDAAIALLEAALRDAPGDPDLENALAWTLVTRRDPRTRDLRRALELARDAVSRSEPRGSGASDGERAMRLDTLAEVLRQAGQLEDAVAFQRRAVQLARKDGIDGDDLLPLTRRLEELERERAERP